MTCQVLIKRTIPDYLLLQNGVVLWEGMWDISYVFGLLFVGKGGVA